MKRFFSFIVLAVIMLLVSVLLPGCNSGKETISIYDKRGKIEKTIVRETFTPVAEIIKSTKNKTVLFWREGWAAYAKATMTGYENPFPTVDTYVGSVTGGGGTFHKNMKMDDIVKLIKAIKTQKEKEAATSLAPD